METTITTQILLKASDIELKALLQQDLQAFKLAKSKTTGSNQGTKHAA